MIERSRTSRTTLSVAGATRGSITRGRGVAAAGAAHAGQDHHRHLRQSYDVPVRVFDQEAWIFAQLRARWRRLVTTAEVCHAPHPEPLPACLGGRIVPYLADHRSNSSNAAGGVLVTRDRRQLKPRRSGRLVRTGVGNPDLYWAHSVAPACRPNCLKQPCGRSPGAGLGRQSTDRRRAGCGEWVAGGIAGDGGLAADSPVLRDGRGDRTARCRDHAAHHAANGCRVGDWRRQTSPHRRHCSGAAWLIGDQGDEGELAKVLVGPLSSKIGWQVERTSNWRVWPTQVRVEVLRGNASLPAYDR